MTIRGRTAWKREIIAWADGAEIQMCNPLQSGRLAWQAAPTPINWDAEDVLYRVKPEKPQNTVRRLWIGPTPADDNFWTHPNLELEFDSETGELVAARVLR